MLNIRYRGNNKIGSFYLQKIYKEYLSYIYVALIAQSVERLAFNQVVAGSSPAEGAIIYFYNIYVSTTNISILVMLLLMLMSQNNT